MDKNNKYYSLIKEQVEKHRKFPGNEYLLDEIIDDVFSHSEVIMNSINNESVITAYLQKVITTSIITVSKDIKRSIASDSVQQMPVRDIEINNTPKTVNNDLVEKMINNSYEKVNEVVKETSEEDEILEQLAEISYETIDELDLGVETTQHEDIEEVLSEPEAENIEEFDNLATEEATEIITEEPVQDEEPLNILEENIEAAEDIELAEETEEVDALEINEIDSIESESVHDDYLDEQNEDLQAESGEVSATLEPDILLEEAPGDDLLSAGNEDELFEQNIQNEQEELEELEETEGFEETELELFTENKIQEEEIKDNSIEKCFPDFSVFEFSPEDLDKEFSDNILDLENIKHHLENIDIRNPELKIKQVYKLKYEEGYSVEKIAKQLGIQEDEIIAGLTELVELI